MGAQLTRKKRPERLTGGVRSDLAVRLARRYATGDSIRALASEAGISYGFAHRLLREAGAVMRSRGGQERALAR